MYVCVYIYISIWGLVFEYPVAQPMIDPSYRCVCRSIYIHTYMFKLGYSSVLGHIHSYLQPHAVSHCGQWALGWS